MRGKLRCRYAFPSSRSESCDGPGNVCPPRVPLYSQFSESRTPMPRITSPIGGKPSVCSVSNLGVLSTVLKNSCTDLVLALLRAYDNVPFLFVAFTASSRRVLPRQARLTAVSP